MNIDKFVNKFHNEICNNAQYKVSGDENLTSFQSLKISVRINLSDCSWKKITAAGKRCKIAPQRGPKEIN